MQKIFKERLDNCHYITGYTQWRNFLNILDKAILACLNSNVKFEDHFADVSKMVEAGAISKPKPYICRAKELQFMSKAN